MPVTEGGQDRAEHRSELLAERLSLLGCYLAYGAASPYKIISRDDLSGAAKGEEARQGASYRGRSLDKGRIGKKVL
jgi:hypothetical protein